MSAVPRPSLPASSSDFALSPSTSASALSPTSPADDLTPFMLRFRRPALRSPRGYFSESRLQSPLASSFTLIRRHSISGNGEESESDRDKMSTDSDSGSGTPFLPAPLVETALSDASMKTSRPRTPATPPRRESSELPPPARPESADLEQPQETPFRSHSRRPSHVLKAPAILRLISEAHRPDENDVQSEAQFQRLVASVSALPSPHTPRTASDRGRYPEEADVEEPTREDTPSDDGELDEAIGFSYIDSTNATKPVTPAQSVNGDDLSMLDSPIGGPVAMDVDMPSISGSPIMSSWRYTPPPTSSAVRSTKRKAEDRYDPYPTSAKRRAVSPSMSYLRETQYTILNARAANGTPRLSMPIPIPIPVQPSGLSSGASSPIVAHGSSSYFGSGLSHSRSAGALSSPTMRAHMGLASPVLRPMIRSRRLGSGDGEKEVDGAGQGVNELSLNDPRSPTLI